MLNRKKIIAYSFGLCFILMITNNVKAQQYNPDSLIQVLKGNWKWEYYYGGFAGLPQTPSNRDIRIEFYQNAQDEGTTTIRYNAFENDSLEYTDSAYMIFNENDHFSPYRLSSNALFFAHSISFIGPIPNSFKIFGDTLELTISGAADVSTYGFKKNVLSSNNNIKQNLSNISFYPNPVEQILVVSLNEFTSSTPAIKVYDTFGKIIFQEIILKENSLQLDFSNKPSGIYLVEMINQSIVTRKTILKK